VVIVQYYESMQLLLYSTMSAVIIIQYCECSDYYTVVQLSHANCHSITLHRGVARAEAAAERADKVAAAGKEGGGEGAGVKSSVKGLLGGGVSGGGTSRKSNGRSNRTGSRAESINRTESFRSFTTPRLEDLQKAKSRVGLAGLPR
jgi:hypothetical protein